MADIKYGSTELIKIYDKEYKELQQVLQLQSVFSSDESIFFYHGNSTNLNIDLAARKFYIKRIFLAFGVDISHLFVMNNYPKLVTVLQYIRKNRTKETLDLVELTKSKQMEYLFDIVTIVNKELSPTDFNYETHLSGLIGVYEQRQYQQGYVFHTSNDAELKSLMEIISEDSKYLMEKGDYQIKFINGDNKKFSKREDIYHWLIAQVSKFDYNLNVNFHSLQ